MVCSGCFVPEAGQLWVTLFLPVMLNQDVCVKAMSVGIQHLTLLLASILSLFFSDLQGSCGEPHCMTEIKK